MELEALTTNFVGRNVASTCNSSGSALWASAKSIKPLVDANYHTEAIDFACYQSPIRFSPIHYQSPGYQSLSLSGQTVLFGCPLELCTVGELKKIPSVLEYLLDSVRDWTYRFNHHRVGGKLRNCITNSLNHKPGSYWPLVNDLEQAWTGVEESDRAVTSMLIQDNLASLILVCLLQYTITEG
jgi:hypothetical protein